MFFVFKEEGTIQNIHCHIKKEFLMHCLNMKNNKIHFFLISRDIELFFFFMGLAIKSYRAKKTNNIQKLQSYYLCV